MTGTPLMAFYALVGAYLVLVCGTDVASTRSMRKEIEAFDQIGLTTQRRHFVLNRADARVGLEKDHTGKSPAKTYKCSIRLGIRGKDLYAEDREADLYAAMEGNGQMTPMIQRYLMIHSFDDATIANDGVQKMLRSQAAIVRKDLELMEQVVASIGADRAPPARTSARRRGKLN